MTASVLLAPTPALRRPRVSRRLLLRTAGPSVLVSAGYVDPGNWGTDVAAGAQFGGRLIWVLAAATAAALLLQHLSAWVGVASGQDLATLIRCHLPVPARRLVVPPIVVALLVTDVVEVLGVVLGVQLLTGLSAAWSAAVAAALVLPLLTLRTRLARLAVYGCLALVGSVYLALLAFHGAGHAVAGLRPTALPTGSLPIAVGLVGAVVMPHNVLLHSILARDLAVGGGSDDGRPPVEPAQLLRSSLISTAVALVAALCVNCSIMLLAADAPGTGGVASAVAGLGTTVGTAAAALFGLTLLAAGLASSCTGGMATTQVLVGLLPRTAGLPPICRRLACLLPATAVVVLGLPAVSVLVWSQVVLTLALPAVLLPLLWAGGQHRLVGRSGPGSAMRYGAGALTAVLVVAGATSLLTL